MNPQTEPKEHLKAKWYTALTKRCEDFMNDIIADSETEDDQLEALKKFVFAVAREQYMTGNKSGIRWARMNPPACINCNYPSCE